ncbi:hypothetical protein [Candidatus Viadribacter manganicus]
MHGDPATATRVRAPHEDDELAISVTNTGAPIPEAAYKTSFNPSFAARFVPVSTDWAWVSTSVLKSPAPTLAA